MAAGAHGPTAVPVAEPLPGTHLTYYGSGDLVREPVPHRDVAECVRHDLDGHPRVRHARAVRRDVVFARRRAGPGDLKVGLAGRREIPVQALRPGTGEGRSLVRDALFGETGPVFAAVSLGNARSLRTFLALGFTRVGSEVLLQVPTMDLRA